MAQVEVGGLLEAVGGVEQLAFAEVETTQEIAQGLLTLGRRQTLHMQQRAGLGVQRVELVRVLTSRSLISPAAKKPAWHWP